MSLQKEGVVISNASYQSFHFNGESRSSVLLAHGHDKYVRSNPDAPVSTSGHGGKSRYAQWRLHAFGAGFCKLENVQTGRYLRIIANTGQSGDKMVDVGGGGGAHTLFRVHVHDAFNVSLESVKFGGYFVGVNGGCSVYAFGTQKQSNSVDNCKDKYLRFESLVMTATSTAAGEAEADEKQENAGASSEPTTLPLKTGIVVIQHAMGHVPINPHNILPYNFRMRHQPVQTVLVKSSVRGSSLRVNPNNLQKSNALGGCGQFARWQLTACNGGGGDVYKLQSCRSSRFLQIAPTGDIDVCGTGGRFTRFRVHMVGDASNAVVFESLVFAGQYLAANAATGEMYVCQNMHDKHCVFQVFTTADSNAQVVSGDNNNNVNSAHVIESQRALIDQQKMLIDQLQKTVTAQQQIIHSLQCNRANVAPSSTLQNEHSSCASTAHGSDAGASDGEVSFGTEDSSDGVIEVEQLPIPASTTMTVMTDAEEDELETPVPSDAEPPPVFSRPELPTFDAIHANAFNMGKIAEDSVVDGGGGGEMDEDEYEYIANPGDTVGRQQGHCPDYVFRWLAADDKWPES